MTEPSKPAKTIASVIVCLIGLLGLVLSLIWACKTLPSEELLSTVIASYLMAVVLCIIILATLVPLLNVTSSLG